MNFGFSIVFFKLKRKIWIYEKMLQFKFVDLNVENNFVSKRAEKVALHACA